MFNAKKLAFVSLAALLAVGCSQEDSIVTPDAGTGHEQSARLSADKTKVYETAARKLAKSLSNAQLRSFIKAEAVKQFDGDYDVLFSKVKEFAQNNSLTGVDLNSEELLASAELPLLNVAVPVHAEEWDAQTYSPLVAYLPEGYNEGTTTQITAFDGKGKVHLLDPTKAPAVPVIVISESERTELKNGTVVLKEGLISPVANKSAGRVATIGKVCGQMPYDKMLYLVGFYSNNISAIEAWALGAPEIRMNIYYADQNRNANQIFYGDSRGNLWEPSRRSDVDNQWWKFRDKMARWSASYGDIINFTYWEEDSGDTKPQPITVKGKFNGIEIEVSTTVHIRNDDEYIGTFPVDRNFCTNAYDTPFGNQSLKFAIDYDDY